MWKWRIGDVVKMRDLTYVPKSWKDRPVMVVRRYTTTTEGGYKNYWYEIKDISTGRRKRGVLAERLVELDF